MIALLEVLGAFGLETALVQRADVSHEHFDSVWTFNCLFGLCLGGIVIALAWPIAFLTETHAFFRVACSCAAPSDSRIWKRRHHSLSERTSV